MTSPYVTSINDEVHSLKNQIHEKIKYYYLSKAQARAIGIASDVMKTQVKLLDQKHGIL